MNTKKLIENEKNQKKILLNSTINSTINKHFNKE